MDGEANAVLREVEANGGWYARAVGVIRRDLDELARLRASSPFDEAGVEPTQGTRASILKVELERVKELNFNQTLSVVVAREERDEAIESEKVYREFVRAIYAETLLDWADAAGYSEPDGGIDHDKAMKEMSRRALMKG